MDNFYGARVLTGLLHDHSSEDSKHFQVKRKTVIHNVNQERLSY